MKRLVLLAAAALLAAATEDPATALQTAKKAADARKPEDVLFALDGLGALDPAQTEEAATLLARAAQTSLEQKDSILALSLCQMALKRKADHADALVACATASQEQSQFDPAEAYVATLRKTHAEDARGPLFAARLSASQGEWEKVTAAAKEAIDHKGSKGPARAEAQKLLKTATTELEQRKAALSESEELTRKIALAAEQASKIKADPSGGLTVDRSGVVLYSTTWCGYCKKAQQFLKSRKVKFVEKDVEKDSEATLELAAKAAAQGINPSGVPVIDVAGTLQVGFSEKALGDALKKAGLL